MLNEDMLSPQEKRICELELKIKEFKEYDKKRQQLMRKIQGDLEEYSQKYLDLKELVENMQDGKTIIELQQDLKKARNEIGRLCNIVATIPKENQQKMLELVAEYHEGISARAQRAQNRKLKREIAKLRDSNKNLATLVNRLQNKIEENS